MTQAETELCTQARAAIVAFDRPSHIHDAEWAEFRRVCTPKNVGKLLDTIERIAAERDEAQRSVAAAMGLQEGTARIVKRLEAERDAEKARADEWEEMYRDGEIDEAKNAVLLKRVEALEAALRVTMAHAALFNNETDEIWLAVKTQADAVLLEQRP